MTLDDGTQLVCVPATPGEAVFITYTVPSNFGRQRAVATSYAFPDCGFTSEMPVSEVSDNTAFFFFVPTGKPELNL